MALDVIDTKLAFYHIILQTSLVCHKDSRFS